MTPEGLLHVAVFLAQASAQPGEEDAAEFRRSAVNRAYYAVFTAARRLLTEHEGFQLSTKEPSHKQVRDKFNGADPLRRQVYTLLLNLTDLRCRADYEDAFPPSPGEMQQALQWADQALDKIAHIAARALKR